MISPLSGLGATDPLIQPPGGAQAAGAAAVAPAPTQSPDQDSFAQTFKDVAANARDTMRQGEAAAIAGLGGEATIQEVVEAMMGAEQQLRTALAIRDRVVAAYQEVSRMQI